MAAGVNLYDNVYGDYESRAEAAVRLETYGTDIGQSSWMTETEWLGFADRLRLQGRATCWKSAAGPAGRRSTSRRCAVAGSPVWTSTRTASATVNGWPRIAASLTG